jgi:hypothetical protein
MLEHPKALSTHRRSQSENLKDITMGNQQETKLLYVKKWRGIQLRFRARRI